MKLDELKDERILILGFGREGKDTLKFLRKLFPSKVIGIADKNKLPKYKKVNVHFGKNYLEALKNYDVVIKSPGIPPKLVEPFITRGQKITSQTEIFLENCPGKIVGITGTKGKGTTSSLIYQILKERRLKAHLAGNIGKPVLNLLFSASPSDIYVYEMSSHQLHNLRKSPHIAVFLNVSQAHLDYFKSFTDYIKAKSNITRHQSEKDFLIYNSRDKIVRKIAENTKAKKIPIPLKYEPLKNIPIPLIGRFNLQNIMAAATTGKLLGISDKNILKAVKKFKPLPYRLTRVGIYNGIEFYNDSAATVPDAALQAISVLGKDVQTIILGGHESKVNYTGLAKEILKRKIKNLIFFPPTGQRIWHEVCRAQKNKKTPEAFFITNMRDAVKLAYQHTKKGKICLLSPAAPSFGIFKDYKQRGNLFEKFVKKYAP